MITLTKDKIIYSNHFNPECDEYVRREVPYLWPYLNEAVELSKDFTLEDLFNHIEKNRYVFQFVFDSCLGHYSLQLYIDEIEKPGPEKEDNEIDYLEIHRWGEYWPWGEIDLSIGFSGVGKKEDDTAYGLGFTPLSELKHLSLRLNKDWEVSEVIIPSRIVMYFVRLLKKIGIPLGKWDNPFSRTYVKGKAEFTVYELITAILNEISFYGSPEERNGKMDELEKITEETMKKYGELDSEEE